MSAPERRVGLWLIGARGSVATCVVYGLAGLRGGLLEPVGLVTERAILAGMDLVPTDNLVLGGHDVCRRSLTESAGELVKSGVLAEGLVDASSAAAAAFEARVRPGLLDGADGSVTRISTYAAFEGAATAEGIGLGSDETTVRDAYGEPVVDTFVGAWWYNDRGISLQMTGGVVTELHVFASEP